MSAHPFAALIRADLRRKTFVGRVVYARPGFFVPCCPGVVVWERVDPDGAVWVRCGRSSETVPRWKVTARTQPTAPTPPPSSARPPQ